MSSDRLLTLLGLGEGYCNVPLQTPIDSGESVPILVERARASPRL